MARVKRIKNIIDRNGEISIYDIMAIEEISYNYAKQIVDFLVNVYPLDYRYEHGYLSRRKPVETEGDEEMTEGESSSWG
jgi:hypothetical protein